jgi:succinyl-CoA synthetase alpha subunit
VRAGERVFGTCAIGYGGRIELVNPRQTEVFGQRCFPSLRALPEPVDHALVIVPAAAVPDVLTDAEEAGVQSATVYASMIGDGEEPESKARGAWLAAFVAKSRLRVAGPNCMGAYSYRERLMGYPNTELCRLAPGSVACLFQSGGTIQFWMKSAAERGLRYSYCVTSGNEPDLGLADYLNFVIDDPETRQVVLFIEGIRRPEAFMHAAGRALAMGKPVLAIKTGATAQSQAASQSHTGAIAGDYAAYLAMCGRAHRQLSLARRSVESRPRVRGRTALKGLASFVTTSGGPSTCCTTMPRPKRGDADFTDATKTALLPMMQEGIAPKNPLDVGIPLDPRSRGCKICATARVIPISTWWPGPRPRARPMPGRRT